MKKTKYFIRPQRDTGSLEITISEAETKRDHFLSENKNEIGEIDSEELQIVTMSNNTRIQAVITLTYFPK